MRKPVTRLIYLPSFLMLLIWACGLTVLFSIAAGNAVFFLEHGRLMGREQFGLTCPDPKLGSACWVGLGMYSLVPMLAGMLLLPWSALWFRCPHCALRLFPLQNPRISRLGHFQGYTRISYDAFTAGRFRCFQCGGECSVGGEA